MTYWAERLRPTLSEADLARLGPDVPRWKVAYWEFQGAITRDHILPYLDAHGARPSSGRLLEVGAGEGGCLAALHVATGLDADGLELSAPRTELARAINEPLGFGAIRFAVGDVTDQATLGELRPPYALVLLRDVIEHVEALDRALGVLARLLAPGGHVLFTFPPYASPFGAHQQLLSRPILKLPWIQHVPGFLGLARRLDPDHSAEVLHLGRCRLGRRRMRAAIASSPLTLVDETAFVLRPAFRYRYRVPVVRAGLLGRLPGLGELLTTGAWFLATRA